MEDELNKWRDMVGGFILAFGDIELLTYRLWSDYFVDKKPIHKFGERTEKIIEKLKQDMTKNSEIINILERALVISNKRNTVAHNPLQVQVFAHTKTGELFFEQAISSIRNDDYIDDAELTELRAEAEGMASRLYMKLGYFEPQPRAV